MRRLILFLCVFSLLGLITARSLLPESAETAMARPREYNLLPIDLPITTETAGSSLVAEMNRHYLFRSPTAKNDCTGLLQGKNLILIWAENWAPDPSDRTKNPTLHRLWQEGARITDVWRPDWYQGADGREFALLTGTVPTNIQNRTALLYTGEQHTYFPWTPARALGQEGYTSIVFYPDETHRDAYEALGFSLLVPTAVSGEETAESSLTALLETQPFFAYYVWNDRDGEAALTALWDGLSLLGLEDKTAFCLLTGSDRDDRAQLFLWGGGLQGKSSSLPCSELDVTATLLNLFGIGYDARFLSGRDLFAPAGAPEECLSSMPLVSLQGSAYSDWVSAAGRYTAGEQLFRRQAGPSKTEDVTDYVADTNQLVYDRYIFSRRAMEMDYFRLVLP